MAVKIGIVGAGNMSRKYHGPSLAYLAGLSRPRVRLEAVCDLNGDLARALAKRLGFRHVFTSVAEMLSACDLDGVCVITPIKATAPVSIEVMKGGVPVYLEKPPGASLAEARKLAAVSARTGVPGMVAFNRRHIPAVVEAKRLAEARGSATYFEAIQFRSRRLEDNYVCGTGLHIIDAIRFLGGDVKSVVTSKRRLKGEGTDMWSATLEFASGAAGRILIKPHAGGSIERFTVSGPECTVFAGGGLDWVCDYPGTIELHEDGKARKLPLPRKRLKAPDRIYWTGFFGEVLEFVESIEEGRPPSPSVAECVQSVKLAAMIQAGRSGRV